jgi:hypothetical protein
MKGGNALVTSYFVVPSAGEYKDVSSRRSVLVGRQGGPEDEVRHRCEPDRQSVGKGRTGRGAMDAGDGALDGIGADVVGDLCAKLVGHAGLGLELGRGWIDE